MLYCTQLLFCCKTLPFIQNQCLSHDIYFGDITIYGNFKAFLTALQFGNQKWFDAEIISISSEEEKAARPTPRTALMHSPSKTTGSLRTSVLLSKVLIPFRDWTTMDWTEIFTWKTDSCQFWTLGIINFSSFCVIMCVTFQGSVPQQQHSAFLWTTAVLQVLLKLNQRVWV